MRAMKGRLCLTELRVATLLDCELDWRGSESNQKLVTAHIWNIFCCIAMTFSDETVAAMKGLLHLSSLRVYNVGYFNGMMLGQINFCEWPHFETLSLYLLYYD